MATGGMLAVVCIFLQSGQTTVSVMIRLGPQDTKIAGALFHVTVTRSVDLGILATG